MKEVFRNVVGFLRAVAEEKCVSFRTLPLSLPTYRAAGVSRGGGRGLWWPVRAVAEKKCVSFRTLPLSLPTFRAAGVSWGVGRVWYFPITFQLLSNYSTTTLLIW